MNPKHLMKIISQQKKVMTQIMQEKVDLQKQINISKNEAIHVNSLKTKLNQRD